MPATQRLLRLLPTDSFLGAAYGAAVEVPKEAGEGEDGKLVWIQAAYEGEFKGYRFPMKLTGAFFTSLVSNLHADPQFKKGENGYGSNPVVRMDYEHASAMPPTEGSIPSQGAPAPGWVCDLEVRQGDGRLELWALCSLGETLRGQIKEGSYRFTSIDAPLESKDPVTGEKRGPKLRALAMTNDPFLRDLEPARIAASASVYGRAESPEELLIGLRQVLELPEAAPPADIKTALDALGAAYLSDARAPGYPDGFGYLIDSIRRLVGLPVLASCPEIIAAAGQALGALSASTSTTPASEGIPPMSTSLSAKLSMLFNCADSEEAILAAATKSKGAFSTLETMMADYGASDPADLVKKAGDAAKKATMAAEAGGKLAELLAALDSGAQEEATNESEQIAASMGFKGESSKGAKHIIMTEGLAARRAALGIQATEGEGGALVLSAVKRDDTKLKAFRANYPLPNAEQQKKVLLTTPITAGAGGVQLGGSHTNLPAGGAPGAGPEKPAHLVEIAGYPGRNDVERSIAMLSEKQPGFKSQPWNEKCRLAGRFIATGSVAAN